MSDCEYRCSHWPVVSEYQVPRPENFLPAGLVGLGDGGGAGLEVLVGLGEGDLVVLVVVVVRLSVVEVVSVGVGLVGSGLLGGSERLQTM